MRRPSRRAHNAPHGAPLFPPLQGGVGGVPPSCKHFPASGGRGAAHRAQVLRMQCLQRAMGSPLRATRHLMACPLRRAGRHTFPPLDRVAAERAAGMPARRILNAAGAGWGFCPQPAQTRGRRGGREAEGCFGYPRAKYRPRGGGTAGRTASLFSIPTARPKKSPLRGLPWRPYFALLGVEV